MKTIGGENKYLWKIDRFNGGKSPDSRIGQSGSFRYGVNNDIESDSGLLGVANATVLRSLVSRPIKWFDSNPTTGEVFAYGQNVIFKEISNQFQEFKALEQDTPNGQGMADFDGYLYFRTESRLHRFNYQSNAFEFDLALGLDSSPDFGMMCRFKNLCLFGHGRYVGSVDDVHFITPRILTLPPGYNVRSIFRAGSFAVILATRGRKITDSEDGMLFLWDGAKETYNDYLPITGNPHAGVAINNKIVIIAGDDPVIQETVGGQVDPIMNIGPVGVGKTAEVWPGAMDLWRGEAYFGISDGTDERIARVLHSWGKKNVSWEDALNPIYVPSHGAFQGSNLQITACRKINATMYVAWRKDDQYGIDVIDPDSYQGESIYRTLAYDRKSPYVKTANRILIELAGKLLPGEYVKVKISPDPYEDPEFERANTVELTEATTDKAIVELPLIMSSNPIKSRDLQVEVRLGGTGTTRPRMKRMWTDNNEDQDVL